MAISARSMVVKEILRLLRLHSELIGPMLVAARETERGSCRFCDTAKGVQHKKTCYVWPLIAWRMAYNAAKPPEDEDLELAIDMGD